MNSEILYNYKRKNDECYTPGYGVIPIIKYIKPGSVVWCPFDTEESQYVKLITDAGFEVVHSHIDDGKDFFNYQPDYFDCIVSNPPFTDKRFIFKRAISFGKPFALLNNLNWLADKAPVQLFSNKSLELLIFDKRMEFLNDKGFKHNIPFKAIYYCHNFLPEKIIFENLEIPKKEDK